MEEKAIKEIIEEEFAQAQQRILSRILSRNPRREADQDKNGLPTSPYERSFFSLD